MVSMLALVLLPHSTFESGIATTLMFLYILLIMFGKFLNVLN